MSRKKQDVFSATCAYLNKRIDELSSERDSLKEQLQKAQHENKVFMHGLVEMEELVASAAYCIDQEKQKTLKAEADKAEAVRIAVANIDKYCNECHYKLRINNEECNGECPQEKDREVLYSLTGQKWREMRG